MHAGGQSAGVAVVGEKGGAVPVLVLIGRDQLSGTNCQGPTVREQTQPECAFVQKWLLGETGLFVTVELRWSDGEWIACCGRHQPSRSSSFSSCSCP